LAQRCRETILAATGLDPALVVVLPAGALPSTSSGKIRRSEALSQWLAGTLTTPEKITADTLAGTLAASTLARLPTAPVPGASRR